MKTFRDFLTEEDGMEVINVAILLAIGLALVVVFKGALKNLWDKISGKLTIDNDITNFGGTGSGTGSGAGGSN